jgi:hypothetical protein
LDLVRVKGIFPTNPGPRSNSIRDPHTYIASVVSH